MDYEHAAGTTAVRGRRRLEEAVDLEPFEAPTVLALREPGQRDANGPMGRRDGGGPEGNGRASRRHRTPHERGRAERTISVSFPGAEWADAVRELARRWRVRPADVMVAAFAHMMADLEAGRFERPEGEVEFWHRAGEGLALEWEA